MDRRLLDILLQSMFRSRELVKLAYEVIDDVVKGRAARRRYWRERSWRKEYVYKKLRRAGIIRSYYDGKRKRFVTELVVETPG